MNGIWKDYFSFTKKERIAVIILLCLIGGFIGLPYFFIKKEQLPVVNPELRNFLTNKQPASAVNDSNELASEGAYSPVAAEAELKPVLTVFDPNTATAEEWVRLGLGNKTIRTILNYRSKGGKFRVPDDFRKIWGLSKMDADRLIPYIRIENTSSFKRSAGLPGYSNRDYTPGTKKTAKVIDINTADTTDWMALPGIGSVLSNRIIHYRQKIGGFTSAGQVKKVYGISDSIFGLISPFLTIEAGTLPKLDLNKASPKELSERTGISPEVAKAIVIYRQQYGLYKEMADLKKIVFMSDSLFQKLTPYVMIP